MFYCENSEYMEVVKEFIDSLPAEVNQDMRKSMRYAIAVSDVIRAMKWRYSRANKKTVFTQYISFPQYRHDQGML